MSDAYRTHDVTATQSPDGTLLVEQHREEDERSGPWETIQVLLLPQRTLLAHHTGRPPAGVPQFPEPGVVVLPVVNHAGQEQVVRVNAGRRTVRVLPGRIDEAEAPAHRLSELLGYGKTETPLVPPAVQGPMARGLDALLNVGAAVLAAGGVWMLAVGPTTKDRWIGAFAAVFFGAGLLAPLWSRLRPPRPKRQAEEERERDWR